MIKTLCEEQLGHALFFSIKMNDFQHAFNLLRLDAPTNTSFYVDQENIVYTTNLIVNKTAQTIKKYGVSHAKSRLLLLLLDIFIQRKADFRCHCSNKNPHYCALSEAFKYIKFQSEQDLLVQENLLILKLLYHGATYKNLTNSKDYKWVGIKNLISFIETKKTDVIDLIRMNRHLKCGQKNSNNRHVQSCALNYKIDRTQN